MTKDQKRMFKALKKPDHQRAFVAMLVHQQNGLGKFRHWAPRYARKCLKKGVHPPDNALARTG